MFGHRHFRHGEHGRHHPHHMGPRGMRGHRDWQSEDGERGHGRRRHFDGTGLRLILLKLIEEKPRHGYDLIREIEERTGGQYAPSPGVVYPTLTLLAEMAHIAETETDGARKLYAVTPEGTAHLAENAEAVKALFAKLAAMGEARSRLDTVPLRRAMHNLRAVLVNRMEAGLDQARLHQAIALIDEAAGKIEKL